MIKRSLNLRNEHQLDQIKVDVELYGLIQRNVAQLQCSCEEEMWKITGREPENEAENLRTLLNVTLTSRN